MYINIRLHYSVLEKISGNAFQALWIEICFAGEKNAICGITYRQHNSPDSFLNTSKKLLSGTVVEIMCT